MNQAAERVESLKAGVIAAIASTLIYLILYVSLTALRSVRPLEVALLFNWAMVWQTVIASFSGFLFGVTYRYIIRQDRNSHLQSGAVLAFGLIRGLAQIEPTVAGALLQWDWLRSEQVIQPWLALDCCLEVLQSVLVFAIAATILNWSIQKKWLKPFT
jgi:hypothetical protein